MEPADATKSEREILKTATAAAEDAAQAMLAVWLTRGMQEGELRKLVKQLFDWVDAERAALETHEAK